MIALEGLQKVSHNVLEIDVKTLVVPAGEIAALVGPPGSGKATLLDLLTGRLRPTVGTVRLAGVDPVADPDQFSRRVGVMFSEDRLYAQRSALSNLVFQCQLYGIPRSRASEVLTQVGLADQAEARLDKLPGGLARRLAFGRAILHKPQVLLLAEPFARCDDATISLLGNLMRQLADDGSAVLILANSAANLALCDTIHVLDQGRVTESYQPEQAQRGATPFKIPARAEGKIAVVLVNPADILYVEAEESRACLQTADGRLSTQFTVSELEERLGRSGFFRAHRGYLVNLQHVREVIPYTRNSYTLRLDDADGTEIPLSKGAARELRDLFGY